LESVPFTSPLMLSDLDGRARLPPSLPRDSAETSPSKDPKRLSGLVFQKALEPAPRALGTDS